MWMWSNWWKLREYIQCNWAAFHIIFYWTISISMFWYDGEKSLPFMKFHVVDFPFSRSTYLMKIFIYLIIHMRNIKKSNFYNVKSTFHFTIWLCFDWIELKSELTIHEVNKKNIFFNCSIALNYNNFASYFCLMCRVLNLISIQINSRSVEWNIKKTFNTIF